MKSFFLRMADWLFYLAFITPPIGLILLMLFYPKSKDEDTRKIPWRKK